MTVIFWVNVGVKNDNEYLLVRRSSADGYYLILDTSPDQKLLFKVRKDAASYTAATDTGLATDRWVHVAGVYDGAKVKLYIDGVLQETEGSFAGTMNQPEANFQVGGSNIFGGFIEADFGEVAVYRTALDPLEVQRHYLVTKWRYR